MRKLLTISVVILVVGTQGMVQEQPDLAAIRSDFAASLDAHDFDQMMSHFAEDATYHFVPVPEALNGKQEIRTFFDDLIVSFPDFHTTEGLVLTAGNIVVVEHGLEGTHGGLWEGFATDKPVSFPHLDIYEFEGDKIKQLTSYLDMTGALIQVGGVPAPEMPALVPSGAVGDPEPTGLSPMEANADHVNRWNSHDAAWTAKIYSTDAKIFAGPLGVALDRTAMTAMNEMYFSAFPDVKLEVVRAIDLGQNWVVTELASRGTHLGSFMGIPAMGYPTEIRAVWLVRYNSEGLVAEGSFYYDGITLTTQMMEEPEYSPAGHWVVTVPSPAGIMTFLHTVSPQEKMGVPYAGIMQQVNSNPTFFGTFPEAESSTDWITLTVRTGRNTCTSTMLVYSTRQGDGPVSETVLMGVGIAKWTLTGPDTNEGTTMYSVYMADQDADGDGFPDEGQEPVVCQEFTFTARRPQMMLPCVPVPGQ